MVQYPNEGARLLAVLAESGGSLASVAKRAGMPRQQLHKYFDGSRTPRLEHAITMAVRLGIPVDAWLAPANPVSDTEPATSAA